MEYAPGVTRVKGALPVCPQYIIYTVMPVNAGSMQTRMIVLCTLCLENFSPFLGFLCCGRSCPQPCTVGAKSFVDLLASDLSVTALFFDNYSCEKSRSTNSVYDVFFARKQIPSFHFLPVTVNCY